MSTSDTETPGPSATAAPGAGPLRGRVVSGAMWKAISQTTLQVVQVVTIVVLSHLLSPMAFGLVGMVTVFASLLSYFTDMAFSAALIQRKEVTHAHCVTAFWMNLGVGTVLTLVGIACAPLVADFFNTPRVEPLFQVMALNLLVVSLARTQFALLMRQMRFRELELRSIAAGIGGAVVGIAGAFAGWGPWALIAQITTMNLIRTGLLWVASDWRPTFDFSWRAWREIRSFSRNVLASNVLYFLNTNADNLIVGKFLGAPPLGIYRLSYNVVLLPIYRIVMPIRNVIFPALSKIQSDRERMLNAWVRVNRIMLALVLPTVVGLVVTAPDFVGVLLGPKWHGAVPVIMALAAVGVLQSVQRLNDSVMQATNRTGQQLAFAGTAFAANLTAFLVGVQFGVVGVAVGAAIAAALVQPLYLVATARALGASVRRTLQGVGGVVAATGLMGLAALAVRLGLGSAGVPMTPRFVLEVVVGIAVYVAAVRWFDRGLISECRGVLRDARGGMGRGRRRPRAALTSE